MSIRLKTVIGVALIEALLLALLIFTVMKYMHESAEEALLKRAYSTAALFTSTAKDPVLAYDLASLDTFSLELKSNPDIEYVRTRANDGVILSSAGSAKMVERPFIQDTNLSTVNDGVFDTSASISESGVDYAVVEIGFNINSIEATLAEARRLTTLIAVIEMVLVALFSLLLGTYLTRQLIVLRSAAKLISKGDYSQQLEVTSTDEVGEVAMAFNQMSVAIGNSKKARDTFEQELIELNRTLERRVNERTDMIKDQMEEIVTTHGKLAKAQAMLLQNEKMASVGQLSAGIAHEINNPIAFIQSNVNTLSEYIDFYQKLIKLYKLNFDQPVSDQNELRSMIKTLEVEDDIDFINSDIITLIEDTIEGTQRVQGIVSGLRDFSHVSADSKSSCDIINCIESTLKIVNSQLDKTCVITTELNSTPSVLANRGELNQVIMNLLINAGQAVQSNGVVLVKTNFENDKVVISISDNGAGIRKEDLSKLFDPFYTTKPVGEGTGLGLAISYGIIQDHGGTISVESEVGIGTTFSIVLPTLNEQLTAQAA